MARTKTRERSGETPLKSASTSASSTFDPTLAALFASSSGPVTLPPRPVRSYEKPVKAVANTDTATKPDAVVEEAGSDAESEVSSVNEEEPSSESESEVALEKSNERPRKRRRVDANDDLESRYLNKLVREEEQEQRHRSRKATKDATSLKESEDEDVEGDDASDSDLNSDLADISDDEAERAQKKDRIAEDGNEALPKHESLSGTAHELEAEKTSRTCFLGNVATSVIKSKSAKKALILHLRSALAEKHHEKVESLRFRSTAFVSDAGPKRAAYAKKELMDGTMKSTNAYVVLNAAAAARKVARLNGTVVLDRHLRVDHLGNPSRQDHKRCVFVGNLSFVDEATATDETEEGEKKRKRAKEPADVEEGLWRSFEKCGKVESVRVVRDKETRISKGFAYVQFLDENAVESALLLDGKKFPPMLPRPLRVSRAKRELKKERRNVDGGRNEQRRDSAPRGRFGGAREQAKGNPTRTNAKGDKVVFEGHRASSNSLPKGLKKLKKRPTVKPTNRGTKRAAAFRAGGGKKKRDMTS